MSSIENTLEERGGRYGSFEHHAAIAQDLQDVMRAQDGWGRLAPDQKQALTVIADKIARMLNGDAAYRDNWHDIVGYAKLVDDRMARDESPIPQTIVTPVNLAWPPRATHYLYNPKAMGEQYYFAELHEGVYYHLPAGKCEAQDWEWDRRGSMAVGDGAWKIVEVRK